MDGHARQCVFCRGDLAPIPGARTLAPDLWVRASNPHALRWAFSTDEPGASERPMVLAYRCPRCLKTFRLVVEQESTR